MTETLLQTGIALALVVGAACYLGARVWRTIAAARRARTEPGCGSGCGCSSGAAAPRPTPVTKHPRSSAADF